MHIRRCYDNKFSSSTSSLDNLVLTYFKKVISMGVTLEPLILREKEPIQSYFYLILFLLLPIEQT